MPRSWSLERAEGVERHHALKASSPIPEPPEPPEPPVVAKASLRRVRRSPAMEGLLAIDVWLSVLRTLMGGEQASSWRRKESSKAPPSETSS